MAVTRSAVGLFVLCGLFAACSSSSPPCNETPSASAPGVTVDGGSALSADEVVDSIGVNIHLGFGDTHYADFQGTVKPRLLDLGVRHVRDGVVTGAGADGGESTFYREVRDLGANGVRFDFIVFQKRVNAPASDLTDLPSVATTWSGNSVELFEGPNEPDNPGVNGGQPVIGWPDSTLTFTQDLYRAVKAIPTAQPLPVAAPTPSSFTSLGDLSAWVDFGNQHFYAGDLNPGNTGVANGGMDKVLDPARAAVAPKPLFITETGYSNAVNAHGGYQYPVTELAAAKYLLRTLGELRVHAVARSYLYELLDDNVDVTIDKMEWHYGLVRADGSTKPAFAALKNLIGLLSDPGPAFVPTDLPYVLTAPGSVHSILTEKRDGTYWLLLWNEVPSYNPRTRCDIPNHAVSASLGVGAPIASYTVYSPRGGTAAVSSSAAPGGTFTVDVPDEVILVELHL